MPMTLAEFYGEPEEEDAPNSSGLAIPGEKGEISTVFLEDLETYRVYLLSLF